MDDKRAHRGRRTTVVIRKAAEAAKRAVMMASDTTDTLDVFVTRTSPSASTFAWEIRRFGALAIAGSDQAYPSEAAARKAGTEALTSFSAGPQDSFKG